MVDRSEGDGERLEVNRADRTPMPMDNPRLCQGRFSRLGEYQPRRRSRKSSLMAWHVVETREGLSRSGLLHNGSFWKLTGDCSYYKLTRLGGGRRSAMRRSRRPCASDNAACSANKWEILYYNPFDKTRNHKKKKMG